MPGQRSKLGLPVADEVVSTVTAWKEARPDRLRGALATRASRWPAGARPYDCVGGEGFRQ